MPTQLLRFIPNQPYTFKPEKIVCDLYVNEHYWKEGYAEKECAPEEEECCVACQDPEYCQFVQDGDEIYVQMRQHKGEDMVCGSMNIVDFNMVQNGDFSDTDNGWTTYPPAGILAGWVHGSIYSLLIVTEDKMYASTRPGTKILQQTVATSAGTGYKVSVTVENMTTGVLNVTLGGDVNAYVITANGTYNFTLVDSGNHILAFSATSGFDGSVDDITLTEDVGCWIISNDNVTYENGIKHVPGTGNETSLTNTGTAWLKRGYYAISVKIKERTAGTLSVQGEGHYGSIGFSENGALTKYIFTEGNLKFTMSDDFDGNLYDVHVYQMYFNESFAEHSIGMALFDLEYNFITHLRQRDDQWLSFADDYVIVRIPPLNTILDDSSQPLIDKGCYKIKVADPIATPQAFLDTVEYVGLSREAMTRPYFNSGEWTLPAGTTIESDNSFLITADGTLEVTVDLAPNNTYKLAAYFKWPPGAGFDSMEIAYDGDAWITYAATNGTLEDRFDSVIDFFANTYSGPKTLSITFTGVSDAFYMKLSPVLLASESFTNYSHESNCLCYCQAYECTKMIRSYAHGHAHGFYFPFLGGEPIFMLQQRLRALSFNPSYPTATEVQAYSDGNDELTHSARKKYKTLHLDRASETVHDCMSIQLILSHLYVDRDRYVAKKQDYTPEWDKDGRKKLAQARVELAKKNNNTYFSKEQ